jgi:hypothetical protein
MVAYFIGFLLGILFILFIGFVASSSEQEVKVGDIVYWKPTNKKCMIEDSWSGKYFICDMSGKRLNSGFPVHRNTLTKVFSEVE